MYTMEGLRLQLQDLSCEYVSRLMDINELSGETLNSK